MSDSDTQYDSTGCSDDDSENEFLGENSAAIKKWWLGGFSFYTYVLKDYDALPVLEIDPQFADIKTVSNVQQNLEFLERTIRSPTACYFDPCPDTGVFYCDQQGCVIWKLGKDGRVYGNEHYVADSIPEFLTRVHFENELWYAKCWTKESHLTPQQGEYYAAIQKIL